MRRSLMPGLSLESCIITALFHDSGKAGFPGIPFYIENPDIARAREGRRYIVNPECPHLDVPTRSLFLVSRYIDLSPEEAQAIRYHDGQYIDENGSVANRELPLSRLLQYADNWSGGVVEGWF